MLWEKQTEVMEGTGATGGSAVDGTNYNVRKVLVAEMIFEQNTKRRWGQCSQEARRKLVREGEHLETNLVGQILPGTSEEPPGGRCGWGTISPVRSRR